MYDELQETHEREMRALRAWYIREHELPIHSMIGDDRYLLDRSSESVFPSMFVKKFYFSTFYYQTFVVELSAIPELNYQVRIHSMSGRDGKYDNKNINEYPQNTKWEASTDNRELRQFWHRKFFVTPAKN